MKKNRKLIAVLLVGCILLQALALGAAGMRTFSNGDPIVNQDPSEAEETSHESIPSHYSPYSFPVTEQTSLFTEMDAESDQEIKSSEPQSAYWWDTDYALTINLEKYAYTVEEDINIEFQVSNNFTAVPNHAIYVKIYAGYWRDWYDYYGYYYSYDETEYTLMEEVVVYTMSDGRAVLSLTDTYAEGMYTIFATDNNMEVYKEFTVGNEGIFVKSPRYYRAGQNFRAGIHLVDLPDFSPLSLAEFTYSLSYYDWYNGEWNTSITGAGSVDVNGYSFIEFYIPEELEDKYYLKLDVHIPGSEAEFSMNLYQSWDYYYYSLWGGEQATASQNIQYVVTTDKTIYSLGETIHLRAMVLEYSFMNETKSPLINTPIQVVVNNPDEFAVYWVEILTDNSGILTFDFPIALDTDIGTYSIQFKYGENSYSYPVKVQYYEKPVFRVEVDTFGKMFFPDNSDQILGSDTFFRGDIVAEYYFGQNVIGATVDIEILTYWDEIVYNETGITDSEGRYHFNVNLDELSDLYYSFTTHAVVTDEYGRTAEKSQRFTRIEETYLWGYVRPWAPEPGDMIDYYFYAYQFLMGTGGNYWNYEYNPLSNVTVNINVYGIHSFLLDESILRTKQYITSRTGVTNDFGSGSLQFQLDSATTAAYDYFQIEITMELEDGRSATSQSYFRYKKYSLSVELDKTTYQRGDTVEITATYEDIVAGAMVEGQGKLYIYDSSYQLVGKSTMLYDGEEHISFSLSDYAKEGTYYLYSYVTSESNSYYGGYTYHSAYVKFEVGESYEIDINTNITTTDAHGRRYLVHSGDSVEISGISNVPSNNYHYLEIYKRGLLYSAPLELIDGVFSYILEVDDLLAPDFTVFVYAISDSGKIIENYLVFQVEVESGFTLSTDKEIYEPGDTITLTITPTSDSPTLVALSFIDSAVLDVEPEDDSELAYFSSYNYAAYLQSSSSWGVGYDGSNYWWIGYGSPNGFWYWPFFDYGNRWAEDVAYDGATELDGDAPGGDQSNSLDGRSMDFTSLAFAFETEIRKNISESANWVPKMWITGATNFTFKLPDNIGEWTIRVVGTGLSQEGPSSVLWGDIQTIPIKSFLPFFVEYEITGPVVQDDIVSLKAYVYNYLGADVTANVAIDAPGMVVLNNEVQNIFVPDNHVSEIEFSVYCRDPFNQNVTILATTNTTLGSSSDGKQVTIYIQPSGLEISNREIGFVNASDPFTLDYYVDEDAIYHQERLAIYSDLMDISLDSWQSLIGYPYGCVEQTISKLLPSVLIYQYLQVTDQLTSDLEFQIQQIVAQGLSRLYAMQHVDGGWGWWEEDESRLYMTSIVLSALVEIDNAGFYVNEYHFSNGLTHLLNQQELDGSWSLASYYGDTSFEATAYIVQLLMNQDIADVEISSKIALAVSYLKIEWQDVAYRGSYGAALMFLAIHDTIYEDVVLEAELITYLLENKQVGVNENFWTFESDENWYWGYFGGTVEITANVIMALVADDYIIHYPILQKATQFLLNRKDDYGWWSTADTSAAIRALIDLKTATVVNETIEFNGTIDVLLNGEEVPFATLDYSTEGIPPEIQLRLDAGLEIGANSISLNSTGEGQFVYIFESTQIIRIEPTIDVSDVIPVSVDIVFNVSVNFSDLDAWYSLENIYIEIDELNSEFVLSTDGSTTIIQNQAVTGDSAQFDLEVIAPGTQGSYSLGNLKISGDVVYHHPTDNTTTYQHFHKEIGPIQVNVGASPGGANTVDHIGLTSPLASSGLDAGGSDFIVTKEGISLQKTYSKTSQLFAGDVITVSIDITNLATGRQFYALDDLIPAGTEYFPNSLSITSEDGGDFEADISGSRLHIYFPDLPANSISISYKLQILEIKNSFVGRCELWGMYDKFSLEYGISSLENIPLQYSTDAIMYRDLDKPVISEPKLKDITDDSPKIQLSLSAEDENPLYKYRIYYKQLNQWRVQKDFIMGNGENLEIILDALENIDSEVEIIIEILDIYGNIARYTFYPFKIFSTLPPYVTIAIVAGVSMGLAGLAYVLTRKPELLKKANPLPNDPSIGPNDGSPRFSFIDEE
ncbi:MAG: MG2 domain-containing protein [Promethearchaeota archaeon]